MSKDSAFLYYRDQLGTVVAWKVAKEAIPPKPTMARMLEDPIPPMEAPGLKATFTAGTVFSQWVEIANVNFALKFNDIEKTLFCQNMEGNMNEFGG